MANFGIDIRILGFEEWDSDDSIEYMTMTDPDEWDLCDELLADKEQYLRTWYNGEWWSNYVDAIIGITAQATPGDPVPVAGVAPSDEEMDERKIFLLLKWQVYWMDDNLVQHEVSHLYDAEDDRRPQPPAPCCVMAYHPHYQSWIWEDGLWWVFKDVACAFTSYDWCSDCHYVIWHNRMRYPLRNLTISVPYGHGDTYPAPGAHIYFGEESVEVWAIPDEYYNFSYWKLDDGFSTDNPITIIMDCDHTLGCQFEQAGSGGGGGGWNPESVQPQK